MVDFLKVVIFVVGVLGIALFSCGLIFLSDYFNLSSKRKKLCWVFILIGSICMGLSMFIPTLSL